VGGVHSSDLGHRYRHVALAPEQMADRRGDVARRQCGRRHLIQQRLEEVMIRPVNNRDADGRVPQGARSGQAPKTAAHDDHVW
jgi:hypothetical protein